MSLFGKNSPKPTTVRSKAAPALSPIAITGLGLACHAGDQPFELITSILGQINGVQLSKAFKFQPADSSESALPRMAPVVELGELSDRDRMYKLTTDALANTAVQIPLGIKAENLLLVIMVNPELITRFGKVDTQHLQSFVSKQIPRLETATFRILPNTTASSTSALRTALADLNEGKWQAIVFGGADSLISIYTCQDLYQNNRLNIAGSREGIVPGEAAAFIVLQNTEAAAKNTTRPLAYLRGVGVAAEPHARDADLEYTEGLSSAITQALTQAGIAATDVQGVVHGLGAETVQALEWHHTTQEIWPRRVSEQQRMAVQMGEIKQADIPDDPIPKIVLPYMTMGYVGTASLPIQLATALAACRT